MAKCEYNPDLPDEPPFQCKADCTKRGYWDNRSLLRHYRDLVVRLTHLMVQLRDLVQGFSLHKLPRYKTNIEGLRVGSGELVPAHFLVPVVFKVVRQIC